MLTRQVEEPFVRLQQVGTSRRRVANLADLKAYHTELEPDAQPETGPGLSAPETTPSLSNSSKRYSPNTNVSTFRTNPGLGRKPVANDFCSSHSTWPADPTNLPRPRGSSWESVRDTAGSTLVGITTPTTLSTVRTIRIRAERQPPTQASGHGGVPRSGRGLGSRRGERSPTTAELIGHRTVGETADLAAINSNFNLNLGANIVL
ncbi:hypothetical protein ACLKA6_017338 [Drosophila palustris]